MGWDSKSRIKLKSNQKLQVEQFLIGILFFGAFIFVCHYLALIESGRIGIFILFSILASILAFAVLNTKGVRFFTTQRQKVEKDAIRLGKLIKNADKRDLAVEEIQNSILDPCFKEEPNPKKQEILEKVANAVSAEKVSLFLPREGYLARVACWGKEPAGLEGLKIPLDQKSAVVKTFKTGRPIISARVSSDPRFNKKLVRLTGAKQVACIPLTIEGETFGVLTVTNKAEGSFSKEDIMHLRSISFSLASRLKNISLEGRFDQEIKKEHKFLTEFAHQIKTPLTAAYGEIELALAEKDEGERKKAMEFALECLKKSSKAIQEALDLSYLKTAKETHEKVDLQQILQEAYEVACVMAEQKGLSVNLNGKNQLFVMADRNKILQAIMNILDNAINYTPKGGEITVDSRKRNGMAVIIVKDTGVGIPKKDINRVFDRFWRGQAANDKEGSGLGLSITKSIIETHEGTVELTSKVGQGTKIQIKLPLAS